MLPPDPFLRTASWCVAPPGNAFPMGCPASSACRGKAARDGRSIIEPEPAYQFEGRSALGGQTLSASGDHGPPRYVLQCSLTAMPIWMSTRTTRSR